MARQPQGALRRHHADRNRLVACHKDIARRLRVNARILAGELDADRTLERYGHGLVVGIPDDVAHIGSREHLVGLKPLWRRDVKIVEAVGRLIHFVADVSGIVHVDVDTGRLDVGFARLRRCARIRVHDGLGDGIKKLVLGPAVVVFRGNGLCQGAVGVGLFGADRRLKARGLAKALPEVCKISLLLVLKLRLIVGRKFPVGVVAVVVGRHNVGLRLDVGLPALLAVVGAAFAEDARINPALDALLGIALVKILPSNGIRKIAVIHDNGNQVLRLHLADAEISDGVNFNIVGGNGVKSLGAVLGGKLRELVEDKRALGALKAHVARAHSFSRHRAAHDHVDCVLGAEACSLHRRPLRESRRVKMHVASGLGAELDRSRGARQAHRRHFVAD